MRYYMNLKGSLSLPGGGRVAMADYWVLGRTLSLSQSLVDAKPGLDNSGRSRLPYYAYDALQLPVNNLECFVLPTHPI